MLFNSLDFAAFFVLVTGAFYALPHRFRWLLLLLASCGFYMAFVPEYIVILFITILIDYYAAIAIEKSSGTRAKAYLAVSIVATCLVLFVFKYFNFFATNVDALAKFLHWNYSVPSLKILLPIGLSFHTFQSLSYVIEVYRKNTKPERNFGIYALYVMFYPQLVAGPIERPQNLLFQFHRVHTFDLDNVKRGLLLMAWGFFKKLVIADRLALYCNYVFANPKDFEGFTLAVGLVFFAYQIYCDFSGYADIARGSARVMGFELMLNFDRPYSARSISEFWSKWHISLSTWFRDYLYFPLGGNRTSRAKHYRNLLVVFGVSGLWHGANWTYVIWGLLNGVYLVMEVQTRAARQWIYEKLGCRGNEFWLATMQVACTFFLTLVAWAFFRANTLSDAIYVLTHMWDFSARQSVTDAGFYKQDWLIAVGAISLLELGQYFHRYRGLTHTVLSMPSPVRWVGYCAFAWLILLFGVFNNSTFIYFQF